MLMLLLLITSPSVAFLQAVEGSEDDDDDAPVSLTLAPFPKSFAIY